MGRKKIDNRIRILIENCVSSCYRSLFIVVGSKGRDQVVILHHMLSKAAVKARPSVLWCYKKELGFSSHRKKRMRQLQKKIKSGELAMNEDDPFELFIASTDIRYCYYRDSHKILGQTFGMLVLQDFEALTPNLLARTIETVEGGGIVVILLQSLTSLKQLYTMTMDVHSRYRTESHQYVVGRFNERFILSLPSCANCLVLDDQLNILPISSNALNIKPLPPKSTEDPLSPEIQELNALKESLQDTQPVGVLINQCRTLDQAKVVLKFVDALSEETLRTTVTLTSARGRGKSAALGLAIAGAVAFNYSNIFVTSPTPENLKTLFSFVLKGFDTLEYQEHGDYEVIQSLNPEFNKAVVRVNIFRNHRQTVQYIHPSDANKLGQAELVVIDEAAAIPLPLVKSLLGPYVVFMASTINGYEGTGRSLSLKLINQLRQQSSTLGNSAKSGNGGSTYSAASSTGRILHEITLEESIRYRNGDSVEDWLNRLLCLDATIVSHLSSGCPEPQQCQLYYISRDTLFSYHKAAESFLHRFVSLYVSSHYKNSPDDLQLMSDAPAHHLFCLLPPVDHNMRSLPEVLCIVQICLEGAISQDTVMQELSRGKRASGDLIPWTLSQQFQDKDFASLSGARIVRIATHPDYQKMGYGLRTLQLLQEYFEGNIPTLEEIPTHVPPESDAEETSEGLLEEQLQPRKSLPPLLFKLSERCPEKLDYIGVSYGLTEHLLRFWKKAGFVPVYLRQTPNELTGEHSCIMLKVLNNSDVSWLYEFWTDFCRRYVSLLSYQFRSFSSSLALSVLKNDIRSQSKIKEMTKEELDIYLTPYDVKRLEMYSKQLLEYHIIMDLMPIISRLYFLHRLGDLHLSGVQAAILLSIGLQHKTVDEICKDLDLPSQQVLGLFSRTVRRITQYLCVVTEHAFEETLMMQKDVVMKPTVQTIDQELTEVAKEIKEKQKNEAKKLQEMDFAEYAIKGSEDEWHKALQGSRKTLISIKSILKKTEKTEDFHPSKKRKKFNKNFKKHT